MERKGKRFTDEKTFVVHPDMKDALQNYRPNGTAIKDVFAEREKAILRGDKYHNDEHDEEMLETAKNRTDNAVANGWRFPYSKKAPR